jgi:hypothetical protein
MLIAHDAQSSPPAATHAAQWPLVVTLYLLLAVPGIPALLIIVLLLWQSWLPAELLSLLNPRYLQTPAPILLHAGTGVLFFLTVPLQFSARLRQRTPRWHRNSGRVALGSGLLMAASGVWMHHTLTPADLGPRYVGLWALSLCIIGCFSMAFYRVCQRRFVAHQRWMCRGLAAVLATLSGLLLELIAALTLGQLDGWQTAVSAWQHDYARLLALGLNLLILEAYWRRQTTPELHVTSQHELT